MNGAQSLIQTLVNGGIEVCFTNPGTSEMHFVAAVDQVVGMRTVLGLFEGVCTGAADGYARMAGKPAATLLHLGPGLANGLANLHNTQRASSPVVNIVGDHATYHLQYDAPLTTDISSFAKPVSGWIRSSADATAVAADGAAAIEAAMQPPGQIATLILPADCAWNEGGSPAPAPIIQKPKSVDAKIVAKIADVLRRGEPTILYMTGDVLMEKGLRLASRISSATGARVMCMTANRRLQSGAGRPQIERLPYPVPQALNALEGTAHLILIGTEPPVAFFAYPNLPSWLTPDDCEIHRLATLEEDMVGALEALAEELNAPPEPAALYERMQMPIPTGALDAPKVWAALSALMPAHSIVADESITSGHGSGEWMAGAQPYDFIRLMGGAIGEGMPLATGAAVACPDRKVFNMQADGSAMYTIQSLWTQARERLNVITILFSNRTYAILQGELMRVGAGKAGPKAQDMLSLGNPDLNWVKLANGMGVEASRATTAEELYQQLEAAIRVDGPHLIEAVL